VSSLSQENSSSICSADGTKRRPGLSFAARLFPLALLSHKRKDIALLGEWGKNEYFFWGMKKQNI
jgi:hypothetical protein